MTSGKPPASGRQRPGSPIPNLVTALRLVLLGPILALIAWGKAPGAYRAAFVLLLAAGASDALDGWLARRLGATSPVGVFFDPLADKILANVLLVFLAVTAPRWVSPWLVMLLLAREFAVQGFRSMAPCKGVVLRTRMANKVKFCLQFAALAFTLAGLGWSGAEGAMRLLAGLSLWLAVFAAYGSMARLFWLNRDLWSRPPAALEER